MSNGSKKNLNTLKLGSMGGTAVAHHISCVIMIVLYCILPVGCPSSLQTTLASSRPKLVLQTVVQVASVDLKT